ncbi:MAG: hypothetical protein JWQ86_924 [Mycobacterium sp.]|jgi:hypothetical protein|nr:hypothetical protein [Mycobacterium sp.]
MLFEGSSAVRRWASSRRGPSDGELALCVFYGLNGIHVDVADDDAHRLIIALACGQLDYRDVATRLEAWLVTHVAARSRRPIKP